jgi:7-cyano-7-deazaguanine synthase
MTQIPTKLDKTVLVVLSGGQDSTFCLFWALQRYAKVRAVTFNYGQRHSIEIGAAKAIAMFAQVPHEVVSLGPILQGTSPLVSDAPLEQYADHASLPGGLEKTFVPLRNQLFLTLAANRAFVAGADVIVTGVCEEDFGGYPDCRRVFIDALEQAITLGSFTAEAGFPNGFEIQTPLMKLTKAATVLASLEVPGCYAATAYSHTAYDGAYPPVGHDHATLLRAKGFEEANVPDPLILRAAIADGLMSLPETPNYAPELVEVYYAKLTSAGVI